jgi:predicted  nucleic acid-binding Zn-ribbon protein
MDNYRNTSPMDYRTTPLTEDQAKIRALEHELATLRSRHEALGGGYRSACEELEQQRKQIEGYKARLAAVRVLCDV